MRFEITQVLDAIERHLTTESALAQDWSKLQPAELVRAFEEWVRRTLIDFARESLKATVFSDLAWSELFELLKPKPVWGGRFAGSTASITCSAWGGMA